MLAATTLVAGHAGADRAGPHGPRSDRDPADAAGRLDLARATLVQDGGRLKLRVATRGPWSPTQLTRDGLRRHSPEPGTRKSRPYLCLAVRQAGVARRFCLLRTARGAAALVGGRVGRAGAVRDPSRLAGVRIERRDRRQAAIGFPYRAAGLKTGKLRWWIIARGGGRWCSPRREPIRSCADRLPQRGVEEVRIERPRITGCRRGAHRLVTHGPRAAKRIALTFDDGPSQYTATVLRILARHRAKATFFVLGTQVAGREGLLRQMVRRRHEIANHTWGHELHPTAGSIAATAAAIRSATGFRPCHYRPPGGLLGGGPITAAWHLGMSTVTWDVDPWDWATPGTTAIRSRVLAAARPGSIVVLHDGGGNRSQTVAALPGMIATLKARGYRLVTVTELLGNRFRIAP